MKNHSYNKANFYIAIILLTIILLIHIDILFAPLSTFFSTFDKADLFYFFNIRDYAFDTIKRCSFPLWTTRIFCGIPFSANSETAIFYLPNVIFFFIPISKAINLSFLIHFFILSFSVFLWINNKVKNTLVSLVVAIIAVFNAGFYLHFYAAHLSNIITACWFPLLLYFYDKTFEKRTYSNIFPIIFIITLQIFAGHFQYVYYSALVSMLYVLFFCRNKETIITIIVSYFFSFFLTAVQLLPSFDFYLDGSRKVNIFDMQNISICSNLKYLITLFFHQSIRFTSTMFWETSNYIGTLSLFVILMMLFHIRNKNIMKYFILTVALYLLTFKSFSDIAQHIIPCFSWFRSPIKLVFFINILLLPLLAYGINFIVSKKDKINIFFIIGLIIFSLLIILFKEKVIELISLNHDLSQRTLKSVNFHLQILIFLFFFFSILLYAKKFLLSRIIIIILLIIEPILIMRSYSKQFFYQSNYNYQYISQESINEQPRFFSYDRYSLKYDAENVVGRAPDKLKNFLIFDGKEKNNNIWGLLRCKYIMDATSGGSLETKAATLNRLNVFYDYTVEKDKEKIYETLQNSNFNIFNTVILEKEPHIKPIKEGKNKLNILSFNENTIDFEIDTTEPAIILYTDNYTKDWQACDIDNPKQKYEIICADYIYKAISVDKGYHRIRFEYKPISFIAGMYISVVSWGIFLLLLVYYIRKNKFNLKK